MCSAAIGRPIHCHNGIVVLVEERHLVIACHGLSRLDILNFVDDNAIAQNDNLIKISQRFARLSLGRIGPSEVTRQRNITINAHRKIFNSLRHGIVNIIRNKIHNNALTTRILKVFAIDKEIIVVGTTPTKIEVEQSIGIVTVTNEGMSTTIAMSRIVHRDTLVDV